MGEFILLIPTPNCSTLVKVPNSWFLLQAIGQILATSTLRYSPHKIGNGVRRTARAACARGLLLARRSDHAVSLVLATSKGDPEHHSSHCTVSPRAEV